MTSKNNELEIKNQIVEENDTETVADDLDKETDASDINNVKEESAQNTDNNVDLTEEEQEEVSESDDKEEEQTELGDGEQEGASEHDSVEQELSDDANDENQNMAKKPYHEKNFLYFGYDKHLDSMDIEGTVDYLRGMGIENNFMEQVRTSKESIDLSLGMFANPNNALFCGFCGKPIYGTEFEILDDGRKRCMRCSRTAIKTAEAFEELFEEVKRNMEVFFSIRIDAPISVEMTNSKRLHHALGDAYDPDGGRALGVAVPLKRKKKFVLLIENGSPRMKSIMTMAHELTHIWQFTHWDEKRLLKKYGKENRLYLYEGMAKWAEIQYAYLINEPNVAEIEIQQTLAREDEYGYGFKIYQSIYGLTRGTFITKQTPFDNIDGPIDEKLQLLQ